MAPALITYEKGLLCLFDKFTSVIFVTVTGIKKWKKGKMAFTKRENDIRNEDIRPPSELRIVYQIFRKIFPVISVTHGVWLVAGKTNQILGNKNFMWNTLQKF